MQCCEVRAVRDVNLWVDITRHMDGRDIFQGRAIEAFNYVGYERGMQGGTQANQNCVEN